MSSSEDNIKTYNMLINILLVIPDYALSHAISSLLITYVKQHEAQINFNFGEFFLFQKKIKEIDIFNQEIFFHISPNSVIISARILLNFQ